MSLVIITLGRNTQVHHPLQSTVVFYTKFTMFRHFLFDCISRHIFEEKFDNNDDDSDDDDMTMTMMTIMITMITIQTCKAYSY